MMVWGCMGWNCYYYIQSELRTLQWTYIFIDTCWIYEGNERNVIIIINVG